MGAIIATCNTPKQNSKTKKKKDNYPHLHIHSQQPHRVTSSPWLPPPSIRLIILFQKHVFGPSKTLVFLFFFPSTSLNCPWFVPKLHDDWRRCRSFEPLCYALPMMNDDGNTKRDGKMNELGIQRRLYTPHLGNQFCANLLIGIRQTSARQHSRITLSLSCLGSLDAHQGFSPDAKRPGFAPPTTCFMNVMVVTTSRPRWLRQSYTTLCLVGRALDYLFRLHVRPAKKSTKPVLWHTKKQKELI